MHCDIGTRRHPPPQRPPPMPPKITAEQALHFAEALSRGTKDAGKIVRDIVCEKIRELV
ncbi:MAG TPA: hypothetical protein VKB79_05785 [Bryobacteraceae bacterium]|nr:hypothetical protein [Bryobacteraceae bacterium]